jgi:MoaA/NifB/PqqE/SkfB family radical SAM enzyme
MSDTFCILPFIHLETRSDSLVAPCCMNQDFYRKDDGELFTLSKDTLDDVWNSSAIKTLREDLVSGKKPQGCSSCWKEESFGKESKRIRENKRWGADQTPTLKFLDLKLGNTCNLKCRICSPGSSSSWMKEHKDIYGNDVISSIGKDLAVDRKAVMQWPEYNEDFWQDFADKLSNIEMFEIYGGEPFLIERHFEVLRKSVELGYSKNQKIHYNTNGTIYPEDAITNIWPNFKEVDVMFSIDGVGEQFEYQRYPAKWNNVLENISKFKTNFNGRIEICLSVSSYNVYYLPEYLEFFKQLEIPVWLNVVYNPSYNSICNLKHITKLRIEEKLSKYVDVHYDIQSIINYLWNSDVDLQQQFVATVRRHDKYRGQDYYETFKEFGEILCQS